MNHSKDQIDYPIIFLHIPKAGGTTLHRIIERQYPLNKIYTIHGAKVPASISHFKHLPQEKRDKLKVIKGHMGFGLHSYLSKPATYITFLRNPINRIISHYYYALQDSRHYLHKFAKNNCSSLIEYVESGVSHELNNCQTRALAGQDGNVDRYTEYGECSFEMLDRAKQVLSSHFSVVGITEEFDKSLILLKNTVGWENVFYVKKNVGNAQISKEIVTAETLKVIEKYNELDLELYQYAKEHFEGIYSKQKELCEQELEIFKRSNSRLGQLYSTILDPAKKVRDKILYSAFQNE